MARRKIIAGNWKMNKTPSEAVALVNELKDLVVNPDVDVVYCVPAIDIVPVVEAVKGSNVEVGAENMYFEESGAYTGEVSASMVASTGATYVILGHSERRQYYGETSETISEKLSLALANGLTPIFCVDEVLAERENGTFNDVVKKQIEDVLFKLDAKDFAKVIIAYEPVWAIGTGKTATAEEAQAMHAHIRATIAAKYGNDVADNTSILYGGSCKPGNAAELFAKPDVDGGLIGGASLKCNDFMGIVNAF